MRGAVRLYHYTGLGEHLNSLLETGALHFSSPLSFNDPYDFDIDCLEVGGNVPPARLLDNYARGLGEAARAASWMADRLVDRYLELDRDDRASMDETQAVELFQAKAALLSRSLEALGEDLGSAPYDRVHRSWAVLKQGLAATYGVRCYSASRVQMLMWSHYSQGHRGVCLEFDAAERPIRGWKNFHYHPISYARRRRIDVLSLGIDQAFTLALTTKGVDWAYEQEHRLVTLRGPASQPCRLASLTGIILGARVGENKICDIDRLFEAIARNQNRRCGVRALQLLAAEKVSGEYAVEPKDFARLAELRVHVASAQLVSAAS